MEQVQTIKVKRDGGKGYRLINLDSFDPNVHEPADDQAKDLAKAHKNGDEARVARHFEMQRQFEANRGQINGSVVADGSNTDGTFSMPTPTDVRFPNKNATEFANNHGAFLGKSAAGMRRAAKLPQVPGGVVGAVVIKGNWRRMSRDEQMELATKLTGKEDLSLKEVKQILRQEVNRRIAEGRSVEDGLTDEERAAIAEATGEATTEEADEGDQFAKMTAKEMEEYLDEEEIDPPSGWTSMKVDEKRDWLKNRNAE